MRPRHSITRLAALVATVGTLAITGACGTAPKPPALPNPTPNPTAVQFDYVYELTPQEQAVARKVDGSPAGVTTRVLLADQFVPTGKVKVRQSSTRGEWRIVFTRSGDCTVNQLVTYEAERGCNDQAQNNPTLKYPRIDRVADMDEKGSAVVFRGYHRQPTLYPFPFTMHLMDNNGSQYVTADCISIAKPFTSPSAGVPGMPEAMILLAKANLGKPGTTQYGRYPKGVSGVTPPPYSCDIVQ